MSWRIILVLVAIGLAAVWSSNPDRPRIAEASDRSVAIATLPCSSALQATSSGYVIDNELVVTVAHAIYESRDFAVRDATGRWHDAFVRYMDLERDLAIVHVEGLRALPADVGRSPSDTDVQMVQGAASGTANGRVLRPVRITTEVVGDLSSDNTRRGYELGLTIAAGDSGAGVVDDDGTLVAIVFARSTSRESITWATAIEEVQAILDRDGVPEWDCGPGSGRELILRPPDSGERDELAT